MKTMIRKLWVPKEIEADDGEVLVPKEVEADDGKFLVPKEIETVFVSIGSLFTVVMNFPVLVATLSLSYNKNKDKSLLELLEALVHSEQPKDVQRGIAMLEASLVGTTNNMQLLDNFYFLAVGYYKSGDYWTSRLLVEKCLEIAPDNKRAQTLSKTIEDRIRRDGVTGIGIAIIAVKLLVVRSRSCMVMELGRAGTAFKNV